MAINSAYAERFGHTFEHREGVGVGAAELQGQRLWRAGNVAVIRDALEIERDSQWIAYLDADAAVVNFGDQDALQSAVEQHAGDGVHFMISRGEVIGPGTSSLFNSGFVMVRQHPWSRDFLNRWWQLQNAGQRNDQEVLEELYLEDAMNAQQHLKILPLGLFYSEIGNPISNVPAKQHVVHLAGVPNEVRRQVFGTFWRDLCSGSESTNSSANPHSFTLRDVYLQSMADFLARAAGTRDVGDPSCCVAASDVRSCLEVAERLAFGLMLRGEDDDRRAAVHWAQKALQGRQELLGDLDEDTLASRSTLSTALETAGRREEALHFAQLAFSGRRWKYGATHRATGLSATKLGQQLLSMERWSEAEPLLLSALDTSPSAPAAPRLLAALRRQQRREVEALELMRSAQRLASNSYGQTSPSTIEMSLELAELAAQLGKSKEAKGILKKQLKMMRQGGEAQGPRPATLLGPALEQLAELVPSRSAVKLLQEAAEVAYAPGSERQLGIFRQWASHLQSLGRLEEAEGLLRHGLPRISTTAASPAAAALANNLAAQLRATGRKAEVEALLRWAIGGLPGEAKIRAQGNLADHLRSLGAPRFAEALPLSTAAAGAARDEDAITAKSNHGILLHALGRQKESEAFYREALQLAETLHGRASHQALGVRADLAELLKRLGRGQEATATAGALSPKPGQPKHEL